MNRKLLQIQRNMVHHKYDHSWIIVCIGNLWVGARPWNKWLNIDGCANCWCATDCYRFWPTQSSCTNCDGLIMWKQQRQKFNSGLCKYIDLVVQPWQITCWLTTKMEVVKCFLYVYFSDGATSSSSIGHKCLCYSNGWYGSANFTLSRHNEVVKVNIFV